MLNKTKNLIRGSSKTKKAIKHFLNYCATHPDAEILFRASGMILTGDSDEAYLVAPQAQSRAGGYHYCGSNNGNLWNGPVLIIAKVLRNVMSSAAECEIGSLFLNAQELLPLRNACIEMGHPQPPIPLRTDNSTANGIYNGTTKQKRSKAIDMRFYWLKDHVEQGKFKVYWAPGKVNVER